MSINSAWTFPSQQNAWHSQGATPWWNFFDRRIKCDEMTLLMFPESTGSFYLNGSSYVVVDKFSGESMYTDSEPEKSRVACRNESFLGIIDRSLCGEVFSSIPVRRFRVDEDIHWSHKQFSSISPMEESIFVAYYPLFLLIMGTTLNSLVFIVLCRSAFKKDPKKKATIHYMRAIAIFDIFMFYNWNLDHYLSAVHGFTLLRSSIPSCKFAMFFGYFTSQTSAWLRVFVCIDRYLLLSRLHRTWFSHSRTASIMIIGIIIFFALLNFHFIVFNCFYQSNGQININAVRYSILPLWDYIHLVVYNCIPFVLMMGFNSGVIYHLLRLRRTSRIQNSRIQHRAISITLLITTCLFLIMTVPASVAFAFFSGPENATLLRMADGALFTYHITSFPVYFLTFDEFRQEFLAMVLCKKKQRQIVPFTVPFSSTTTDRSKAVVKRLASWEKPRFLFVILSILLFVVCFLRRLVIDLILLLSM